MKDLKNIVIEKLIINKSSKVKKNEVNSEHDFVKKYNLKMISWDSTTHTYEMPEELANKIHENLEWDNKQVNDYITNELKVPNDYQFCSGELANHKQLIFYFEDLNDDIIDSMIFYRNDKTKFIYEPYHINYERYKDMKGKLFNVLDFIIENG